MPRAATTADVFNAVAERRRRAILDLLGDGEASVGEVVSRLDLPQPLVSKHLRVLREVDLVRTRAVGRERRYRLNASALKPVHDWVSTFERHWNERLDRLEEYLGELHDTGAGPPALGSEPGLPSSARPDDSTARKERQP